MPVAVTPPAPAVETERDGGFTLVELLVAMGIFTMLMAIVTVVFINGIGAIRTTTTSNDVQAQQENAMLWMSRLLRYTDNPTTSANPPAAIVQATPTSMAFFSYAGVDTVDRLPYKVVLCKTTRGVESFVWAPTLSNGAPVVVGSPNMTVPACNDTGATGSKRRLLLPIANDRSPALGFRYWRKHIPADGAGTADVELVPSGSLTTAQLAQLDKVEVTLTDAKLGTTLDQIVALANER
jgi:prepilin-type N-terminal cleavage/methylation domain-containing protein